jgi:hypothetical protein
MPTEKLHVKVQYDSVHECFYQRHPEIAGYHCSWISRNLKTMVTKYTFVPTTQRKWGI